MKKALFVAIAVLALLLLTGCLLSIKDVKSDEYVGKSISVRGTVLTSIKIGPISGFTLQGEENETIAVKSDSLPKEGSKVTVKGVVMKDTIFGYYILASE